MLKWKSLHGLPCLCEIYIIGMDNSHMKKTNAKIESVWDYLNPKNLKALKDCNYIYKQAKAFYDKAKTFDDNKESQLKAKEYYRKAKEQYKKFLEINTADFDTLIEIGICCYELDQKRKSLHYLLLAQELRSGSTLLKSYLFQVYAANKDWNNALDYFKSLKGRIEPAEIQKLRKKIPDKYKRNE